MYVNGVGVSESGMCYATFDLLRIHGWLYKKNKCQRKGFMIKAKNKRLKAVLGGEPIWR